MISSYTIFAIRTVHAVHGSVAAELGAIMAGAHWLSVWPAIHRPSRQPPRSAELSYFTAWASGIGALGRRAGELPHDLRSSCTHSGFLFGIRGGIEGDSNAQGVNLLRIEGEITSGGRCHSFDLIGVPRCS